MAAGAVGQEKRLEKLERVASSVQKMLEKETTKERRGNELVRDRWLLYVEIRSIHL